MIACSPKVVSPRESSVEETNGRGDVDWVLRDLENNFGNKLRFFEEFPWLCSEGAGEMSRSKMLEDFDCLEDCELCFAMSIRARDKLQQALNVER
jgi:hypothetical protein